MIDEKLIFTICFIILLILVYKPAKRAILQMLDREIAVIDNDLKNVTALRNEAEINMRTIEKQLKQIIDERDEVIAQTLKNVEDIKAENMLELNLLLKRKEQDAVNRIEAIKSETIEEIRHHFILQSQLLATKYAQKYSDSLGKDEEIAKKLIG